MPNTIWTLTSNSLGDLITGSEDHKIRTFTRDYTWVDMGWELEKFNAELTTKRSSIDLSKFNDAPDISE